MACKLLEGVTIVAASLAEAGPAATQALAFLGADVWHIERPSDRPDPRHAGFLLRNSNKKDITLNTKEDEGKAILRRLLEKADVFFENFAPGAWNKMGFSYEDVKKINPTIIYATLKGFSNTKSRWKHCVTFDPVATCSGGNTYVSGYENMYAMMCGVNVGDSGGAIHAAMEIALAVLRRRITGKGMYLECPMQNAVVCMLRSQFAERWANGAVRRSGNAFKGTYPCAPHNVYPTQGRDLSGSYVVISCTDRDSADYLRLCRAMGREDLANDPDYATPEKRYENRHRLDAEIKKWTMLHTRDEVMDILARGSGVKCGSVMSVADLWDDESARKSILHDVSDELLEGGFLRMPAIPVYIPGEETETVTCGAHGSANEEVYKGVLGMTDEELADLKARKII